MVLEFLKNTHKFISDGYQKFTDLKKALGFDESDKEKALQQMIHQAGVQVDNVKPCTMERALPQGRRNRPVPA